MTTHTFPNLRAYMPADFTPRLIRNIVGNRANPFTKRRKVIEHPGPLWSFVLAYPRAKAVNRGAPESFWNTVSAADAKVAMWHLARPLPVGTLQADTVTAGTAAAGDSTIDIAATTGLTLLAGDMFSVVLSTGYTQLVQVRANVTSVAGEMSAVAFVPALVASVAAGAAVKVQRPTALFTLEEPVAIAYSPGYAQEFAVVLLEAPEW